MRWYGIWDAARLLFFFDFSFHVFPFRTPSIRIQRPLSRQLTSYWTRSETKNLIDNRYCDWKSWWVSMQLTKSLKGTFLPHGWNLNLLQGAGILIASYSVVDFAGDMSVYMVKGSPNKTKGYGGIAVPLQSVHVKTMIQNSRRNFNNYCVGIAIEAKHIRMRSQGSLFFEI